MKLRVLITVTASTAAVLGGTGAFLLPASASPHTVTRTLTFTAVRQASVNLSRTSSAESDKDITRTRRVIGYDLVRFTFNPTTGKATGGVTVVTKDGFLYGLLTLTRNPVIHGRVTGGTGAFRGATGTITAKTLNHSGTRTAVTIKYHT